MAGLAAARSLQAQGYKVIVLEARDRLGGRIWTDRTWGVPLDLGAAWIHRSDGNPIAKLAQQLQISTIKTDFGANVVYGTDGKQLTPTEIDQIEQAYKTVQLAIAKLRDQPQIATHTNLETAVSQILAANKFPAKILQGVNTQLASQIEIESGASLSELGLQTYGDDSEFTGSDLVFPQGYDQIVNGLAVGLNIQLGTTVSQVEYDHQGVNITTNRGQFRSDRAIITVPLGVLKQGRIKFSPPLPPAKQQAIQKLGMGALNKVVLQFPRQFWDSSPHYINLLKDNRQQMMDYWNWQRYVDAPILVALVGGAYSRALEQMPLERVVGNVMTDLKVMFGKAIPEPTRAIATKWHTDPLAGGSYSIMPPGAQASDYDALAAPVGDRLFFAGEATTKTYPSTVHGAFLTGEREAQRIAKS